MDCGDGQGCDGTIWGGARPAGRGPWTPQFRGQRPLSSPVGAQCSARYSWQSPCSVHPGLHPDSKSLVGSGHPRLCSGSACSSLLREAPAGVLMVCPPAPWACPRSLLGDPDCALLWGGRPCVLGPSEVILFLSSPESVETPTAGEGLPRPPGEGVETGIAVCGFLISKE